MPKGPIQGNERDGATNRVPKRKKKGEEGRKGKKNNRRTNEKEIDIQSTHPGIGSAAL